MLRNYSWGAGLISVTAARVCWLSLAGALALSVGIGPARAVGPRSVVDTHSVASLPATSAHYVVTDISYYIDPTTIHLNNTGMVLSGRGLWHRRPRADHS
jgi:hypothetical protein